jgi:hypothetical protein
MSITPLDLRLRARELREVTAPAPIDWATATRLELAAAEIERLRAALEEIRDNDITDPHEEAHYCRGLASRTLEQPGDET